MKPARQTKSTPAALSARSRAASNAGRSGYSRWSMVRVAQPALSARSSPAAPGWFEITRTLSAGKARPAQAPSRLGRVVQRRESRAASYSRCTPPLPHVVTGTKPSCPAALCYPARTPAAAAGESKSELRRFAVARHGAAELRGVMLQDGVERQEVDAALSALLDEIEQRISEDQVMGGPPEGTA